MQNIGLHKDIKNLVRRKKRPTINIVCLYYYFDNLTKILIY